MEQGSSDHQAAFFAGPFACATSGPQAREGQFFGTGVPLPTEGYGGCNLAGGIQNATNPSGPTAASQVISAPLNGGTNALSTSAKADFTGLSAKADGSFTGTFTDAFTFASGEGAAYSTDTLTQAGSGLGFLSLGFTIEGSVLSSNNSQTQTFLDYQIDSGSIFRPFSINTVDGTSSVTSPTDAGGSLAGFTASGANVSGTGTAFSFLTPITLGQAFDLTLGLYASSYPGLVNGNADNEFSAQLTSIQIFDATGKPIDVAITSTSGTLYDASGAHGAPSGGVPEPVTWTMLLLGLGSIGAALRWSNQNFTRRLRRAPLVISAEHSDS